MPFCPTCGTEHAGDAVTCPACGRVLSSTQADAEAGSSPGVAYAGFRKRLMAYVIDWACVQLPLLVLFSTAGGSFDVTTTKDPVTGDPVLHFHNTAIGVLQIVTAVVVGWLYFAMQESSEHQATLGKRALRIVVIDLQGRRISFARATGRYFAKWISDLILLVGYMMAGWTKRKQALHDKIVGTLVVVRD